MGIGGAALLLPALAMAEDKLDSGDTAWMLTSELLTSQILR